MPSSNGNIQKQNTRTAKMKMNDEQIKYIEQVKENGTVTVSGNVIAAMLVEFFNLSLAEVQEAKAEAAVLKMIKEGGTLLTTIRAQLKLRKYFKCMLINDGKAFEKLIESMKDKELITVYLGKTYKKVQ